MTWISWITSFLVRCGLARGIGLLSSMPLM